MRKPKSSGVVTIYVEKEIIEIESDSDTDEVEVEVGGGRMLALCGPVNESHELANTVAETNKASMQIVCADDSGCDLVFDSDYMKYLAVRSENENLFLLEDNVRESSPLCLMYNEAFDRSKGRVVECKKRKAVSSVSKRLKTENGRADRKLVSRIKETKQKKGDAQQGKKIPRTKYTVKLMPASDVKETRKKKEDVRRGKKNIKACKKEKEKRSAKRNVKSLKISRAPKRLKTENGRVDYHSVKTKDAQGKKREALQGRKIHVTKNNVGSKSKSHVNDKFKASKKENEKSMSSMDKSYAYYIEYLRNAVTIFESDEKVKPVKDLVSLNDPDIIAVSNHPFSDGDNIPFEANKDEKVIDVEHGIEPDDIFNSSFGKELLEILRKPYDKEEFLELSKVASLKRPVTRSRELRDGRDITYNILDQFTLSFLEQYPDFEKMFRRHEKDCPRALNLLRGFFFYLENIVREGAFKPWKHEKRLMNMCFDASGRKAIVPSSNHRSLQ